MSIHNPGKSRATMQHVQSYQKQSGGSRPRSKILGIGSILCVEHSVSNVVGTKKNQNQYRRNWGTRHKNHLTEPKNHAFHLTSQTIRSYVDHRGSTKNPRGLNFWLFTCCWPRPFSGHLPLIFYFTAVATGDTLVLRANLGSQLYFAVISCSSLV